MSTPRLVVSLAGALIAAPLGGFLACSRTELSVVELRDGAAAATQAPDAPACQSCDAGRDQVSSLDAANEADVFDASTDTIEDAVGDAPADGAAIDAGACCSVMECGGTPGCLCAQSTDCCAWPCASGVCVQPFPCGPQTCMAPAEYCATATGGQPTDAGPAYQCRPMPAECSSPNACVNQATCDCIERTNPCSQPAGVLLSCSVNGWQVGVACGFP